jgi:hypothetical protein
MNYAYAVRAVLRNSTGDMALPAVDRFPETVVRSAANSDSSVDPPRFIAALTDRDATNDEIDLEVLLITTSDDECVIVPAFQGPRIVSQSASVAAGYITGSPARTGAVAPAGCPAAVAADPAWAGGGLAATGPYGSWRLPLTPYKDLKLSSGKHAVVAGRFASLVALQTRPPLSESSVIAAAGDAPFRCGDVPANTPQEVDCKQSGLMYSGIQFSAWDSDGDGTADMNPQVKNVYGLEFADPTTIEPESVSAPASVLSLASVVVDPPSVPPPAPEAQIRNLMTISCAAGGVTAEVSVFKVDCPSTTMKGLVVSDTATFAGEASFKGNTTIGDTAGDTSTFNATAKFKEAATFDKTLSANGGMKTPSAEIQTANFGAAGTPGQLLLGGVDMVPDFSRTKIHTFDSGKALVEPKPTCPTGYVSAIEAVPASIIGTGDVSEVNTAITPTATDWTVDLIIKSQSGDTGGYLTKTNPGGAKLFVQTRCDKA